MRGTDWYQHDPPNIAPQRPEALDPAHADEVPLPGIAPDPLEQPTLPLDGVPVPSPRRRTVNRAGRPVTASGRPDYTARARDMIEAGLHPANGRRLADAPQGETCGTCAELVRAGHGAKVHLKCSQHRLGVSRSEASDMRAKWPACPAWHPIELLDDEGPDRG